jgi:ribosome-associated protein
MTLVRWESMAEPRSHLQPIALPGNRQVPEHAIRERTSTSGGPGGQHANRSATGVELAVLVHSLPLTAAEHEQLTTRLGARISADGWVSVRVQTERSQLQNRREARTRMQSLLAGALHRRRIRRPTSVPPSVDRARLEHKRQRSSLKRLRSWRPGADGDD